MTPHDFIAKWRNVELKERSASQSHFNDLCALLDLVIRTNWTNTVQERHEFALDFSSNA